MARADSVTMFYEFEASPRITIGKGAGSTVLC